MDYFEFASELIRTQGVVAFLLVFMIVQNYLLVSRFMEANTLLIKYLCEQRKGCGGNEANS